jgi:hypothetical protein
MLAGDEVAGRDAASSRAPELRGNISPPPLGPRYAEPTPIQKMGILGVFNP